MILYSVIIPAFNEEEYLPKTLTSLQNSMQKLEKQGEIIVVDNNSTDNTANVATKFGAIVISEPINHISKARNRGVSIAKGKYLIFLDADTTVSFQLLKNTLDAFNNESIIGGGSTLKFDTQIPNFAKLSVCIWNYFSTTFKYPAGCYLFCSKEVFTKIGGFNEKIFASEEIWFARRLKSFGKPLKKSLVILHGNPVITSSRKFIWYPMWKLILTILFFLAMPITIRMKSFCSIWYHRPPKNEKLKHA